jgi:HK97 family phage major capsid protein
MNDLSVDAKTAHEITRAIKALGDDTKGAFDALEKSLADLRTADAETKKYADVLITDQVKKMSADFVARHEALEGQLKSSTSNIEAKLGEQLRAEVEKIEAALRRTGYSPEGDPAKAKAELTHAVEHKRVLKVLRGEIRPGEELKAEDVDLEEYRSYRKSAIRYMRRTESGMGPDELKALTTGSDPQGGYFVTPVMSNRIITRIFETSPIRQLASVQPIGTDRLSFVVDWDEAGVGWVGEEEARPETGTPSIATVDIEAQEQYAKPRITQRLLEDASIDLEAWVATKVSDKFSRSEATAFVTGNGIKKPRGFLTYPSGAGYNLVEQVATGNATAVTADSIISLPWKLKDAYRRAAQWLLRRSTMPSLVTFKDQMGQYLYGMALRGATVGDTLAGYPLSLADDMPDVAAGSLPIAFADFRTAYQIVDRIGISMLRDPYSSKPYVEFYFRRRLGGAVVLGEAIKLLLVSA